MCMEVSCLFFYQIKNNKFQREPGKDAAIKAVDNYLVPCNTSHIDTWRVLEKWYKNGTFRVFLQIFEFSQNQSGRR